MHPFVPHSSGLSCRSAAFAIRPLPFLSRPLLFCSSVLSLLSLARARRRSPVFDTDTIPDPTPCEAVTFSWTGGVPPYSLLVGSPDTLSIVSEIDSITDLFVSWTPPSDSVDMTLVAFVFDDDESFDTTNEFVVQPASCLPAGPPAFSSCLPAGPPAFSSSSVSAESSTPPYPISPIPSSTDSSAIPPQSVSTSAHTTPSGTPPPSSSSAQSSSDTTSTRSAGNGTSVGPLRPTASTTGAPASSEAAAPSQPHPSTTISHWRFTSRPRRKPPSSSPSASEIVGMVLGSVALVGVLVGIIVWRRMTVARGRATSRRASTSRAEEEGSSPAAGLESSYSTLVQQTSQVSTKPIANRHRISAASSSHATPVGLGLGSGPAPPLAEHEDDSDILHIHNDMEANSVAVEPSTSHTDDTLVALLRPDSSPLKPPGLSPTRASKTELSPLGGEGATEVEAVLAPAAGTKAREDVQSPGSDVYRISSATAAAPYPHAPQDEEQHVLTLPAEAETALGSGVGTRARRVTLTLLECDGGVRLAGGPPVDVVIEGERCPDSELLSDSADGSIEIVTLPPPYHRYNI